MPIANSFPYQSKADSSTAINLKRINITPIVESKKIDVKLGAEISEFAVTPIKKSTIHTLPEKVVYSRISSSQKIIPSKVPLVSATIYHTPRGGIVAVSPIGSKISTSAQPVLTSPILF